MQSISHTHTQSVSHTHTQSVTHTHTHTHPRRASHTHTTQSVSHTHTHHTPTQSISHTHTQSVSHTHTHTHTHTPRASHTHTERHTHTHTEHNTHTHTERHTHTHPEHNTHTHTERHTHTQSVTHTPTQSDTHTHTHTPTQSDTHTHTPPPRRASHLMSVEVCGHTCEWEESHLWLLCPGSATDGCCALNWDPFGKSCYFFSNVAMTWDEAQDWCTGHESHLVILSTDKEWDFVVKHSAGTWYWVGLTDRTGKWEWVNHTPYVMDRRRWRPGQPDSWTGHGLGHGDEDCGQLHSDGRLNDLHCLTQLRYICQKHS
uniref:C-type lectin domain-containing protein n=1 Tax=Takifugu rubripes TaxID=31033 RepID=A0A674NT82_TAKRU